MKYLLGFSFIIGGIAGMVISTLSTIVTSSSFVISDGINLSLGIGIFCAITFIGGIYTLFVTD